MSQPAENAQIEFPEGTDENVRILQLVVGQVDGEAFWAYVAMLPTKYQEYYDRVSAGLPVVLDDFGETLQKGWGEAPPEDIEALMAEDYGADPDFEENAYKALEGAFQQQEAVSPNSDENIEVNDE